MLSQQIAKELKLQLFQVENTIQMLDEDNTVPFIARYRKEKTGELDENLIREIQERVTYLRNLATRKQEVIRLIAEQEKLTPELEQAINQAKILQEVEDLYRPYKQKRRTRAGIARERGLGPLAELMLAGQGLPAVAGQAAEQGQPAQAEATQAKAALAEIARTRTAPAGVAVVSGTPEEYALAYVNPEAGVEGPEEALAGARDIIAEEIADHAGFRKDIRAVTFQQGIISCKGKPSNKPTAFDMYFDYQEPVKKLPPHRILAINRGEKEEVLTVKLEAPDQQIIAGLTI